MPGALEGTVRPQERSQRKSDLVRAPRLMLSARAIEHKATALNHVATQEGTVFKTERGIVVSV